MTTRSKDEVEWYDIPIDCSLKDTDLYVHLLVTMNHNNIYDRMAGKDCEAIERFRKNGNYKFFYRVYTISKLKYFHTALMWDFFEDLGEW